MSLPVFHKAIKLIENYDSYIIIGGGEPTLHPNFWQIIGECLGATNEDGGIWMATNGSRTEISLKLAKMAKAGILGVALSQDEWHDPIDEKVVEAFTKKINHSPYSSNDRENYDMREIRTVTSLMNQGRAKDNDLGDDNSCACEEIFISPEGNLKQCGCLNAPVLCNILNTPLNKIYKMLNKINENYCCFNRVKEKLQKAG